MFQQNKISKWNVNTVKVIPLRVNTFGMVEPLN